ncbi:MAG: hypothetical protein ACE5FT_03070 [Candidatus Nanoarchaeia archaeon]
MKRIALLSIMVLLLAVAAFDVAAYAGPATFKIGDDDTRASNPDADDIADQNSIETGTITITNSGTTSITGFAYSVTPLGGFTTNDLDVNITFDKTSLAAAETMTATITVRIPEDLDAVSSVSAGLDEQAEKVANIVFTTSGTETFTSEMQLQRENQLQFEDIDVCINDENNCENVNSDGDDVEGIRPGDEIILKIEVENKYSDSDVEDIDFDDVTLEYEIDEDDLNEDDDEDFDLDAEENNEETFRFTIDDDVSDGNYEAVFKIYGKDDHGALHGEEIKIDLEVERKSHEVDIRSFSVSPSALSCRDLTTTVRARLTNIGKRDENNVAFEVVNTELGIRERTANMDLDEDRSTDVAEIIKVPEGTDAGRYRLSLRSFFDGTAQSDEESVEIVVPDCSDEAKEDEEETTTVTKETELQGQLDALLQQRELQQRNRVTSTPSTSTGQSGSTSDDTWILVAMGVGALILIVLLVFLMVKIFKR